MYLRCTLVCGDMCYGKARREYVAIFANSHYRSLQMVMERPTKNRWSNAKKTEPRVFRWSSIITGRSCTAAATAPTIHRGRRICRLTRSGTRWARRRAGNRTCATSVSGSTATPTRSSVTRRCTDSARPTSASTARPTNTSPNRPKTPILPRRFRPVSRFV